MRGVIGVSFLLAGIGVSVSEAANPIRKVVNLLQAMQKKVAEEGDRAEVLYQKYMCYCKQSNGDLDSSIAAATEKMPQLDASIKAAVSQKVQLEGDLKSHMADRSAAKEAVAEATAIRRKEKAAFDKSLSANKDYLAAAQQAVAAIEKGMGGSFLQTVAVGTLQHFLAGQQNMLNSDRQEILAFLSGQEGGEYAPASGEIVGILKQMIDEMLQEQKELLADEASATKSFAGLKAAKAKEVGALQQSIEEKLNRVADLGVKIVTLKDDRDDTSDSLEEDQKFAGDIKKNCAEKTGIHEKEKGLRAQETVALADTIKILNDDDALELFKKTLPSASASLVQVEVRSSSLRERASLTLATVRANSQPSQRHRLDYILLALRGKKIGFDKVIKLVDELVVTLKQEQNDDDAKKEYCEVQLDATQDKETGLKRTISDLASVIEEAKEGISTLTSEIAALKAGIVALDNSLSEATNQRKAENAEHKELMASDTAAKELILFAKNRMQKFYNPRLHKAAPERDLSEGDRIYTNEGGDIPTDAPGGIAGTGITALAQMSLQSSSRDAPSPPPATAAAYTKKAGESGGVLAMMDLLVADLDKDMTESAVEEKNAAAEYAQLIADSADKRRQDSKSLVDKEGSKADFEVSLEQSEDKKKSTGKELMGTMKYAAALHSECDWLQEYYDVRKSARADEIDALGKAKAVLSGADFSLVQRDVARSRKFLRRV